MKFELSFTNKEITPWGGMVFLKQLRSNHKHHKKTIKMNAHKC
jgi:hypothetical protein